MLLTILLILLLFSLFGGGWGYSRWGYGAWSPLGFLIVLIAILYLIGALAVP